MCMSTTQQSVSKSRTHPERWVSTDDNLPPFKRTEFERKLDTPYSPSCSRCKHNRAKELKRAATKKKKKKKPTTTAQASTQTRIYPRSTFNVPLSPFFNQDTSKETNQGIPKTPQTPAALRSPATTITQYRPSSAASAGIYTDPPTPDLSLLQHCHTSSTTPTSTSTPISRSPLYRPWTATPPRQSPPKANPEETPPSQYSPTASGLHLLFSQPDHVTRPNTAGPSTQHQHTTQQNSNPAPRISTNIRTTRPAKIKPRPRKTE